MQGSNPAVPRPPAPPAPPVMPLKRLTGKVALITGSSRGIGASIARAFHAEGARVAICYHESREAAHKLVHELGGVPCMRLDVRRWGDVRRAIVELISIYGRVDCLVNNAGYLEHKDFFEITQEDFDHTLDINFKGLFQATQEAARIFRDPRSGNVINISSIGAQFGGPKAPHYSAAKAAVIAFTKSAARILAPFKIRVNAIAPGYIRTDMISGVLDKNEAEIAHTIPLGRIGEAEDVARAAVYLASDESAFVTGHVLNVNGGQWMG